MPAGTVPRVPAILLAVCSTGGHLNELRRLVPRLDPPFDHVEWATFDTPQSRSQLAGQRVHFVRTTHTRDARSILLNLRPGLLLVRRLRPQALISTGSGMAMAFLPAAAAHGIPSHYVESATRVSGPSATGRALAVVPGVRTYTQDRRWQGGRWWYSGSVFDEFAPVPPVPAAEPRRIVVVLGTNPYPFRRLLERLLTALPPGTETILQSGVTDLDGLPLGDRRIDARALWPADELHAAMASADVVVAHAGMGAAIAALEAGRVPVLVPRLPERGEQVDDHQLHVAADLAARGLAVAVDPEQLDLALLRHAAGLRAHVVERPPPFRLRA